jgi:hypothetical protein
MAAPAAPANTTGDVLPFKATEKTLANGLKIIVVPTGLPTEAQRDAVFTTHTCKHTTMGFLKDIEDMPNQYAYSKVFFDRW